MTIDDCRLLICEGKIPTSTINIRHSAIINLSLEGSQQRKFVHFAAATAISGKLTSSPPLSPKLFAEEFCCYWRTRQSEQFVGEGTRNAQHQNLRVGLAC
jgi:hypothetical protein